MWLLLYGIGFCAVASRLPQILPHLLNTRRNKTNSKYWEKFLISCLKGGNHTWWTMMKYTVWSSPRWSPSIEKPLQRKGLQAFSTQGRPVLPPFYPHWLKRGGGFTPRIYPQTNWRECHMRNAHDDWVMGIFLGIAYKYSTWATSRILKLRLCFVHP